jgi:pyruvoyl-dependent arginine decarboxylase (PvlArgDC)
MTDNPSANAQPIAELPHPGPISRARFFASCHPIAVSVSLAVIIAFGIATLAALVLDVTPERREVFIPGVAAISLTAIGAAIFPLVARMHSIASGRDIAAAVVAATDRERPHLLAEIEGRLFNRYWRAPMTVFQLAMMFREVRKLHGERAYRKQLREQAARAEQNQVARAAVTGSVI